MASITALLEESRQSAQNDDRFLREYVYYFELQIPEELSTATAGITSFIYPLIIAPESYQLSEPFTVAQKVGLDGGLFVEESGIIARKITLAGHTGFKPRTFQQVNSSNAFFGPQVLTTINPERKSYARFLQLPNPALALSGQRHFHYLQDAVFRTYGDLKRDPSTAKDTRLFFHVPKDEESWEVVPESFDLDRNASDRVLYRYRISLLAVGPATGTVEVDFSEDKTLLDELRDVRNSVNDAVNVARGAVQTITALVGEVRQAIASIDNIIDNVNGILTDAQNFLDGTTNLIQTPIQFVVSVTETVEEALGVAVEAEELGTAARTLPDSIQQTFRRLGDGLEQMSAQTTAFETPVEDRIRELKERQELRRQLTESDIQRATNAGSPSNFKQVDALGTAPLPGEIIEPTTRAGRDTIAYTGAREITVRAGDTLPSLASRYLGDARLWQQIATLNNLRPPFVSSLSATPANVGSEAFPGALGVGQKLLIPSFVRGVRDLPLLPVLGVSPEEPAENHLLGTDFKLSPLQGSDTSRPVFGFEINTDGGSVDLKQVNGVTNMAQSLTQRIVTERGTDVLYRQFGTQRVVGFNFTPVDLEIVKIRIAGSLQRDPRVTTVKRLALEARGDSLIVDADIELRGFAQAATIRTEIGS